MKRLRIGFNSNAYFSQSGYGQQMAELMPLIRDEGYPLMNIDYFGLDTGKIVLDGINELTRDIHVLIGFGVDAE